MLKALFSPSPAKLAGRALYAQVSAAARRPSFYLQGEAPDTPEGRFELYLVHLVLLLRRLRGEGAQAQAVSQALFDAFVRGLDDGLREMGVGDLSVGKKMRRMGEAIYGRLRAYDQALATPEKSAAVAALLSRTLYDRPGGEAATLLAAYVLRAADALSRQPLADLLTGRAAFPELSPEDLAA